MNSKTMALGVDIGGTKIRAGLVDSNGIVGKTRSVLTDAKSGPDAVIKQVVDLVSQCLSSNLAGKTVYGIGVGAPGPLDVRTGIVKSMPNLPAWQNYPIRDRLEEHVNLPVQVINDADAACLCEYVFGAARGRKNFITLTLGTGIGSSIMIHGRLWHGKSGISPEIGHVPVALNGPVCSCGSRGHLESFSSSRQMIHRMIEKIKNGSQTMISPEQLSDGSKGIKLLADAARNGDRLALAEFHRYGKYLGRGLAVVVNLLNLPLVVITGGLSHAWDLMVDFVEKELFSQTFETQASDLDIVLSSHRDDSGVLGAGALCLPGRNDLIRWI
jgi:glucokinase